jgi:hypothetical protein
MNWYVTREDVKRGFDRDTDLRNEAIDFACAYGSRQADSLLGQREGAFIPETKTRKYSWPNSKAPGWVLRLDAWLISVTSVKTEAGATTIPAGDVLLEPFNSGPPYNWIEVDRSSTDADAVFQAASGTPQRAIEVAGSWAYSADTEAAGALDGALSDTTGTSVKVSDGSVVDVGHTLLIGSEQMFVSEREFVDAAVDSSGALNASENDEQITLDGVPTLPWKVGEVIRYESEEMRILGVVSTTVFNVDRAVNGTTIASHVDNTDIFISRTLTVVRGVNGTTAATHLDTAAVTRYVVPNQIRQLALAEALNADVLGLGGYTGGAEQALGEGFERGSVLADIRRQVLKNPRYGLPLAV